jgi:hypothetical protein
MQKAGRLISAVGTTLEGGKMRINKATLALGLLLLAGQAGAFCESYPDVRQEYRESEFVFVAKVLSEEKVLPGPEGFFDGIDYRLEVIEELRGRPPHTFTVFSENSSGRFPMDKGAQYLVFTSRTLGTFADRPVYTISYFGNSGLVREKKAALALARKLKKSAPNQHLQLDGLQPSASGHR